MFVCMVFEIAVGWEELQREESCTYMVDLKLIQSIQ
jgi:hypothetical protein